MRRFFQAIFWLIFLAGCAAAYFVAPSAGLTIFVAAVPFAFASTLPSPFVSTASAAPSISSRRPMACRSAWRAFPTTRSSSTSRGW